MGVLPDRGVGDGAALGESVRTRRVIAADALERAEQAERTREEEARARVDAERLRIAREVHDTVAHAIAIINVQAGVTAYLLDKRPERAREALVTIEQTSAQALHEMRAILGVLRDPDNGRVPHPGLGQVDELTAMAREAGLDIKLEVTSSDGGVAERGGPHRLPDPAGVDHQRDPPRRPDPGDGRARLRHRCPGGAGDRRGWPRCRGDDPRSAAGGRAVNGSSAEPGRGIVGMRERCGLLGGELTAGPRPAAGSRSRRGCRWLRPERRTGEHRGRSTSGGNPIKVLLADDQVLVRSGFKALLDAEDDITVVGEAANGAEAVERARATRPDVVLMDIRMPELDGIKATSEIVTTRGLEQVRILILTTYDTDAYVFEALQAGASGFLLKDAGPAELLHAIRVVAAGEALLAPRITRRLIAQFTAGRDRHPGRARNGSRC